MPSPSQSYTPPTLPSLNLSPAVLRQIRTLLLCSTTPQEHLADLHFTRHSTSVATYHISALSLPSSNSPPPPSVRFIPLTPTPILPRHSHDLALPLSASASLTSSSIVTLTLHAHVRNFSYALDAAVSFAARDAEKFAQSALGIVLTGGGTLRESENMGVLRMRNTGHSEVLEPVYADAEGDAGVWLLGGGGAEIWEALNGFAERVARRRNRRLGKKEVSKWVAREIVVLRFSERGDAVLRRGWMRVLCGKEGVERYSARMSEGGEGRFVRQGWEPGGGVANARALRSTDVRRFGDIDSAAHLISRRERAHRESPAERGRERSHDTLTTESRTEIESRQDTEVQLNEGHGSLVKPNYENFRGGSNMNASGNDDQTMNVMCLKYLSGSYTEEIKRHMNPRS